MQTQRHTYQCLCPLSRLDNLPSANRERENQIEMKQGERGGRSMSLDAFWLRAVWVTEGLNPSWQYSDHIDTRPRAQCVCVCVGRVAVLACPGHTLQGMSYKRSRAVYTHTTNTVSRSLSVALFMLHHPQGDNEHPNLKSVLHLNP